MSTPREAPYGTWDSPLKPADFSAGSVKLDQVYVNPTNGKIYSLEIRPHEAGRGAIIEYDNGISKDVLPKRFSALSQVHEYGGSSMLVKKNGNIIFTDFETKGVYDLNIETQEATPIVQEDPKIYYADFAVNGNWVVAIKEDHYLKKIEDIENTLVAIDPSTKKVHTIVKGSDFYAYPRFSPDGKKICWISWNHPEMPWTKTELWVADWQDGKVTNSQVIAGKEQKSSITQPVWDIDGSLFFVDDRTGFWQLYQMTGSQVHQIQVKGLDQADFCGPDWWLGCQWYTPLTETSLFAFRTKDGEHKAILIDKKTGDYTDPGFPVNQVYFNSVKRVDATKVAVIGATATAPASFFLLDTAKLDDVKVLKSSFKVDFPVSYYSKARSIKFPRVHDPDGGHAYGIYLAPNNPKYKGESGTLPPLIVAIHGGPTWGEGMGVYMRDQFWTTRGYAVVQVNYVGSTGYGKEFTELLDGEWGISDIADAVSCAKYLIEEGLVDGKRIGITGHSAGGYATMHAMCMYPDFWAAGVAESGISDIQFMLDQTHKFESQYFKPLLFKSTDAAEYQAQVIKERSPIHHTDKIKAPMLILAGGDDNIVPLNQATMLADKIREGGGVVDLAIYPGEGHCFSKGTTLEDMEVRREAWFRKYLVGGA